MTKKIAMIFPGQGSQTVGMIADYAQYPIVLETFAAASKVLGYDLWKLCQEGPEEKLNQTEITQPALLTASVAVWRVWQQLHGPKPIIMAGHSLGEYTALVCAEVIEFTDAVALVAARGRCMQEAMPDGQGAMAAIIGIEDAVIEQMCTELSGTEIVAPANYNAPGQIVVAGHTAVVDQLISKAKDAGAKIAKRLNVSVPSHCALMTAADKKFESHLEKISYHPPRIPIIHNATLTSYTNIADIKLALRYQLHKPVRWSDTVRMLFTKYKVDAIVECGPDKVLTNMIKRIEPQLPHFATNHGSGAHGIATIIDQLTLVVA